jgi:hypothetical protein
VAFPALVAKSVVRNQPETEGGAWVNRLVEVGAVLIGFWWLLTATSDFVYH